MYTRSSRVDGSMSQGNLALRPRTALTSKVATKKEEEIIKNNISDK